jgi:hypothetical protein
VHPDAGLGSHHSNRHQRVWPAVWRRVQCHRTQMSIFKNLARLPPGAPSRALGCAGVIPRVQPRERRPAARV